MARRFVGRGRSLARSPRRQTVWAGIDAANTAVAQGTAVLVATSNAALDALRPFTIVRTHLTAFTVSDQLIADEQQFIAIGMAVVSDQASAIGVTVVPTPHTDVASDLFFLHQWLATEFTFITGAGFSSSQGGRMIEIDSKAQQ